MPGRNGLLSASRAEDDPVEDDDTMPAEGDIEDDQPEEGDDDQEVTDDAAPEDEAMDEEDEEEAKAVASLRSRATTATDGQLKAAMREGRRLAQARIQRILGSTAAAKNMELARTLALTTTMSSKDVIAVLGRTPASASGQSDFRQQVQRTQPAALPSGGSSADGSKPGSRLIAAAEKRAGGVRN